MGTFPCLNCANCNNITKGQTFTHPQTGQRINITDVYKCNSTFVIYLIKWPRGLAYVGETTQKTWRRSAKKIEMKWISKLGTLSPGGLNREYSPEMFI
ncbi:hypothetical protein XELAEV_18031497mg [Xenopus laevis]|uniref:Uncharacterized protein n=1 Tax=Xenopus laevis TaxID=8355 RepID=A0A974CN59_XENLA|nr:hypothetical protein XELAEV_18031497mg [Xenopus laevis]